MQIRNLELTDSFVVEPIFFLFRLTVFSYKIMKLRLSILLFVCSVVLYCNAETKEERMQLRHELRIGWGDQMYESVMFSNPFVLKHFNGVHTYHENLKYDQHLWLEYQNRHNEWFSYGAMFDYSNVRWTDVVRDGEGVEQSRSAGHHCYNIVFMPTIRFTYLHLQYFNMFFGLGFGLGINGGSEMNTVGKRTDIGLVADITLLGFCANYERWFWTVDIGGLSSVRDMNTIFMLSSRIFSVGLGVRF